MASNLDTAIRLVSQAVIQDSKKNYEEAARCYREGIINFRIVLKNKCISPKVRSAIESKNNQYEIRLKKLEKHLLYNKDFSGLFKAVVQEVSKENDRFCEFNDEESKCSEDTKELYGNPFLRKGLEKIERARKLDTDTKFPEALQIYEIAVESLLDAVQKGRVTQSQKDIIRIKCLLIKDRTDIIRNHLEYGAPIAVRKQSLNSLENSLGSESGSPVPIAEEEEDLLEMTEIQSVHSNFAGGSNGNIAGSTHSLYPQCEIKRCLSSSDIHHQSPPLVDMAKELRVSLNSVASSILSSSNQGDTLGETLGDTNKFQRPISRMLEEDSDGILVLQDDSLTQSSESFIERDRNVSELTYVTNDVIDPDLYKIAYEDNPVIMSRDGSISRSPHNLDSSSDSGISDPAASSKSPSTRSRKSHHSMNSSSTEDHRKSPLSDIDSLDIVPSLPHHTAHSSTTSSPDFLNASTPTIRKKKSSTLSSQKSSRSVDDLVQVLSEEHVIDGRVVPSVLLSTSPLQRYEYIPPRAFARQLEEQDRHESVDGCFLFMSCLDSFGIL